MTIPKKTKLVKSEPEVHKAGPILADCSVLDAKMDSTGSGEKSSHQKSLASATPGIPTQEEVLHIYRNVCQLTDIERYLNILYTPFSCLATTTSKYDLWELETFIPHARYDPERHLAVSVNRLMPVTSLKIYPNGNIYCQGFNRDATRRGVINIIEELRDLGYNCRLRRCQFNVVNATFSVPFHLNLDQLHLQNPSFAQYDPIKKPFVTYTLWGTMVKFAIFPTGYVYVMSASTRGLVKLAISKLLPILYCYKGSEQDESEQSLTCGDINYKLLWEKYFQENDPSD